VKKAEQNAGAVRVDPVRVDPAVRQFNSLNERISAMVPAVATASDTLNRAVPLLCQMQDLLSQRPRGARFSGDYHMLHRVGGVVVGATMATGVEELPSWTAWLRDYARQLNYSIRHLQRLIFDEPKKKYLKECGWSAGDHNRLLRAAGLALELARAEEAGSDTTALRIEIHQALDGCEDLLDEEWTPVRTPVRKRPARKVTREGFDFVA
jgi:hypothetical protein